MPFLQHDPRAFGLIIFISATLVSPACSPVDGQTDRQTAGAPQALFEAPVGFGAKAAGGRGGKILAVTTLSDRVDGSLRACIEAQGPRTCVFRVAGVFRFSGKPPVVHNPYLTLAGQTAPGGGVTIAHDGSAESRTPLLIKDTHDVVIQHVRVRNDRVGGARESEDSITIEQSRNILIDHVSASWARDELINGYGNNDRITISNSLFAYGIPKHDKCALLASDPTNVQNFSFIGNICAHNGDRNPDINFRPSSCVEVVNNVFYNAQSEFAEIWETYAGTPVAIVGNIFKAGPNTAQQSVGVIRQTTGTTGKSAIYLHDNEFIGRFNHIDPSVAEVRRDTPPCPLTVSPMRASDALRAVLAGAGAWPRDEIDARVVADIRAARGRIVKEPGAIPAIAPGNAYPDDDGDGMDDRWERANGAKVGSQDAWADADGDGINNFDTFLAARSRELMS